MKGTQYRKDSLVFSKLLEGTVFCEAVQMDFAVPVCAVNRPLHQLVLCVDTFFITCWWPVSSALLIHYKNVQIVQQSHIYSISCMCMFSHFMREICSNPIQCRFFLLNKGIY